MCLRRLARRGGADAAEAGRLGDAERGVQVALADGEGDFTQTSELTADWKWPCRIWPSSARIVRQVSLVRVSEPPAPLLSEGRRRAGWYGYDGLDNGGVPSADRIVPELQRVEVGDLFPWTPKATDGFIVRAVEPERALILGGDGVPVIWALVLEPSARRRPALFTRGRGNYERFAIGLMLRLVWRPIRFGMQRRQLLNLKRRVEAARSDT